MIDTGENNIPKYKQLLEAVRDRCQIKEIAIVLITHYHKDHMGGLKDVQEVFKVGKVMKYQPEDVNMQHIDDKMMIKTENSTITVMLAPGHSDDHLCFYLHEEQALFSGDNVLGKGNTFVTDLQKYMQSLIYMRDKFPLKVIYPGHGSVIMSPVAKINSYISNRKKREIQVLQKIRETQATEIDFLVDQIYQGLNNTLKPAAKNNVLLHVKKLYEEGELEEKVFKKLTEKKATAKL